MLGLKIKHFYKRGQQTDLCTKMKKKCTVIQCEEGDESPWLSTCASGCSFPTKVLVRVSILPWLFILSHIFIYSLFKKHFKRHWETFGGLGSSFLILDFKYFVLCFYSKKCPGYIFQVLIEFQEFKLNANLPCNNFLNQLTMFRWKLVKSHVFLLSVRLTDFGH